MIIKSVGWPTVCSPSVVDDSMLDSSLLKQLEMSLLLGTVWNIHGFKPQLVMKINSNTLDSYHLALSPAPARFPDRAARGRKCKYVHQSSLRGRSCNWASLSSEKSQLFINSADRHVVTQTKTHLEFIRVICRRWNHPEQLNDYVYHFINGF